MNRRQRRALERQVRKGKVTTKGRRAPEQPPEGVVVLPGEVLMQTFQSPEGQPFVVVEVRNAGGTCKVALTPEDFQGVLEGGKLVLEDVEVAHFVAEVEAQTGAPAKVVDL